MKPLVTIYGDPQTIFPAMLGLIPSPLTRQASYGQVPVGSGGAAAGGAVQPPTAEVRRLPKDG